MGTGKQEYLPILVEVAPDCSNSSLLDFGWSWKIRKPCCPYKNTIHQNNFFKQRQLLKFLTQPKKRKNFRYASLNPRNGDVFMVPISVYNL